jgi:hypothetical protein
VRGSARLRLAALVLATLTAAACAARRFVPPTAPGTPDAGLAAAWGASIARCADLRSLAAEIALAGKVDGRRVRGRLQVGLTREGGVRIEAVAPFGAPLFTLAGGASGGVLWLPRSQETVRATPSEILEALTGIALGTGDLFEIVTACPGVDDASVRTERFDQAGLARAILGRGTTVWWKPGVTPLRPIAVQREGALVEYRAFAGDRPQSLRLSATGTGGAAGRADLTLTLSQVEANPALGPEAFTLDVPPGARVLTISELRQAGVLR